MHGSRMFVAVVFASIAVAAAPTYVMSESTADKVERKECGEGCESRDQRLVVDGEDEDCAIRR